MRRATYGTFIQLSLLRRGNLDGAGRLVSRQTYIEDCEVCCRPIEISYMIEDDALVEFAARTTE